MKTNDYLLLMATGAYSFLFFEQNAGINFLLFNIIFLSILIIKNKKLMSYKKWWWSAGMCIVSSAAIFVHSSDLSILANILSLLLVSALSFNIVTSTVFSFAFSCFSVASSIIYIIIDSVKRLNSSPDQLQPRSGYKVFAIFIVSLLAILFFAMYKSANPLFAENTKWINLDLISIDWIAFTLGGFIIVYGLFYHRNIGLIERWENGLSIENKAVIFSDKEKQYETERFAGMLLFTLLNLMLVVLNIGDIQTLYFNGGLPKGMSHSDFVHSGVGIIILSIIITTSLIMFLYRKEFDVIKNNKVLSALTYAWILQNLLMLSSTALRNQIYIHDYNFTYKRIGVYVWLVLAAIGLLVMFWKLYKQRSNWYLIRTNVAIWFTALTLSSLVNWDKLITNYNIQNKPLMSVDFEYLFSLSDTNIPELIAITKSKDFDKLNSKPLVYNGWLDTTQETYGEALASKVSRYLRNRCSSWKSFDLREQEVYRSIYYKH